MKLRLPLRPLPLLAAVTLGVAGLVATAPGAPAEAQRWSSPGGGGIRFGSPPRGPGGGFRPPPAGGFVGRPPPAPGWSANRGWRPPPAPGWSANHAWRPPPGAGSPYRPGLGAPWGGWAYRPFPYYRAWYRPWGTWSWYRPAGAWGWYRPWGWWGYGVFVPAVTFGVGINLAPGYYGYPYYGYPYAPPYPPPPAYYPPAAGATCVAGAVTCPLQEPATPGDACNCPTPNGAAWGRVAG